MPLRNLLFLYDVRDSAAGGALFANGEELLDGVEDMQVLYGLRDAAGNVSYQEAGGGIDWRQVVSLKIELTLNSIDRAFSQNLDPDAPNDGLVRKTVTHVIALRNSNL